MNTRVLRATAPCRLVTVGVVLAVVVTLPGCGGGTSQSTNAAPTLSPASTSPSPDASPTFDDDQIRLDNAAGVRIPAPAFDAPASPTPNLTTGAFTRAQAHAAYQQALTAFTAYRQDPTLSLPIRRTRANFQALYPTMTARLREDIDRLVSTYLSSSFNAGPVDSPAAAQASNQLNSLFYLPVPEGPTETANKTATSAGGGYDPTGAFGRQSLTGVMLYDAPQNGSPSIIVVGTFTARYNTLDENRRPKTFEIITTGASLSLKPSGGRWLVDSWNAPTVRSNLIDRVPDMPGPGDADTVRDGR